MKCDLALPACRRCSTTGRVCTGYPSQEPAVRADDIHQRVEPSPVVLLQRALQLSTVASDEAQSFQFFQLNTATELAGEFDGAFWSRLVPQVSHREDCIRHMVLALSSLHQSISTVSDGSRGNAADHYSRALRSLNHHIVSNQGAALDITLLSSILCVTFEWLRANYSAALVHLRAGMKLLQEWHEASLSKSSSPPRTSFWSPSGHLIRSSLLPFYTRLFLQAQALIQYPGLALPPAESPEGDALPPFTTLNDARDGLFEVLLEAYNLKHVAPPQKHRRKTAPVPCRPLPPSQALTQWCARLDEFFARAPKVYHSPAALILRIWRETVSIMLLVKDSQNESDFDRYTPNFRRIINLAGEFYAMKTSLFSAELSIVAVLYYVGVKCRNPLIRRQALALLTKAPRREGIWDSTEAARIVKVLLEMEEARAQRRILVEADIERDARIGEFVVNFDDERGVWSLDPDRIPS